MEYGYELYKDVCFSLFLNKKVSNVIFLCFSRWIWRSLRRIRGQSKWNSSEGEEIQSSRPLQYLRSQLLAVVLVDQVIRLGKMETSFPWSIYGSNAFKASLTSTTKNNIYRRRNFKRHSKWPKKSLPSYQNETRQTQTRSILWYDAGAANGHKASEKERDWVRTDDSILNMNEARQYLKARWHWWTRDYFLCFLECEWSVEKC